MCVWQSRESVIPGSSTSGSPPLSPPSRPLRASAQTFSSTIAAFSLAEVSRPVLALKLLPFRSPSSPSGALPLVSLPPSPLRSPLPFPPLRFPHRSTSPLSSQIRTERYGMMNSMSSFERVWVGGLLVQREAIASRLSLLRSGSFLRSHPGEGSSVQRVEHVDAANRKRQGR